MTADTILALLALLAFGAAAFSVPTGRVNLIAVGLFLWVLTAIV